MKRLKLRDKEVSRISRYSWCMERASHPLSEMSWRRKYVAQCGGFPFYLHFSFVCLLCLVWKRRYFVVLVDGMVLAGQHQDEVSGLWITYILPMKGLREAVTTLLCLIIWCPYSRSSTFAIHVYCQHLKRICKWHGSTTCQPYFGVSFVPLNLNIFFIYFKMYQHTGDEKDLGVDDDMNTSERNLKSYPLK